MGGLPSSLADLGKAMNSDIKDVIMTALICSAACVVVNSFTGSEIRRAEINSRTSLLERENLNLQVQVEELEAINIAKEQALQALERGEGDRSRLEKQLILSTRKALLNPVMRFRS